MQYNGVQAHLPPLHLAGRERQTLSYLICPSQAETAGWPGRWDISSSEEQESPRPENVESKQFGNTVVKVEGDRNGGAYSLKWHLNRR